MSPTQDGLSLSGGGLRCRFDEKTGQIVELRHEAGGNNFVSADTLPGGLEVYDELDRRWYTDLRDQSALADVRHSKERIEFECLVCRQRYSVPWWKRGESFFCKKCEEQVWVPRETPPELAASGTARGEAAFELWSKEEAEVVGGTRDGKVVFACPASGPAPATSGTAGSAAPRWSSPTSREISPSSASRRPKRRPAPSRSIPGF